jgi:seryl-tRNA synthetase
MLDIALLRKKFTFVKEQINKRYKEYAGLNRFHEVDSKWRDLTTKIQKLNSQRNDLSDQISILMSKKMFDEANKIKSDVHGIKQTINTLEKERTQIDDELLQILFSIPNIPHESVIVGKDEKDNKLIRS